MVGCDAHAEDRGSDVKAQRRVEHQRLAVDAGRDGAVGVDLEARGGPLAPWPLHQTAALGAPGGRPEDGDPEQAVIDPWPCAGSDGPP